MSGKLGLFGALHELAEVEIEIEPVLAELRPNQLLFFWGARIAGGESDLGGDSRVTLVLVRSLISLAHTVYILSLPAS